MYGNGINDLIKEKIKDNEINCELRFLHDCIRGVKRDATRSFTVRGGLRNDKTQTNNSPFAAFRDKHKQHNDSNAFGSLWNCPKKAFEKQKQKKRKKTKTGPTNPDQKRQR
ncbi:hypothetical protein RFI_30246 [Reticulomyxa filosa]|uniref:Uncharacterized protein n=1 Tax=Reticulomyxa filosa TaxID=46433 RepID=X6M0J6_RETFI|nr:hypothetical protein RFI_30246 [Reticulomyxa filosa]|eukprot:ETO07146.1 hypothetical protein RFI_30246 [Reticulomyxa filosa]